MGRPETGAYVAVLVTLLAATAAADERERGDDGRAKLDLVWVDPVRLAPCVFDVMKNESTSVLARLGADVTWTAAQDGAVLGPESMAVIAVPTHHAVDGTMRHVM